MCPQFPGLGKIEWSRSSQCCRGLPLSPARRSQSRAARARWRVLSPSIVCCDLLSSSRSDWAALGHIAFPARVAETIGWQTSPFQFEVGVANLGIGFAGLYAAFRSFEARLATNLVLACFLIGAGIGHIRDIVSAGNFAPGNAGPMLFTDLLTPTAIFLLLWSSRPRGEEREAVPRRTPARQGR